VKVISSPQQMQKICLGLRAKNKKIAVVPTMGFLHEGHLTLLKKARRKADTLILTLFVNPTQFGPKEDLNRYPQDKKGDLAKARLCGVDYVFMPKPASMYPEGYETYVDVVLATKNLCGASRPGHFKGVTTIVAKLFQITQPSVAFFGLKDFQQFAVIKKMVQDLNMPVQMIGVPTVREKDGLALSSRNVYLNPEERRAALCLSQGIAWLKNEVKKTPKSLKMIRQKLVAEIKQQPLAKIDYLEFVDAVTLQPLATYKKKQTLLAMAVFIGKTRLIDNVVV